MKEELDQIKQDGFDICPGCGNRDGNRIYLASENPDQFHTKIVCIKCGIDWLLAEEPTIQLNTEEQLQYIKENDFDVCPECENPNRKHNEIELAKTSKDEIIITCADCRLSWGPEVPTGNNMEEEIEALHKARISGNPITIFLTNKTVLNGTINSRPDGDTWFIVVTEKTHGDAVGQTEVSFLITDVLTVK